VTRFEGAEERWAKGLGGVRDVVRQHVVAAQLQDLLVTRGPSQVLDAGCGQGTQALALARAGHHVTGLDPSRSLLGRFGETLRGEPGAVRGRVRLVEGTADQAPTLTPGPFDVVLCHGVLMYLDDAEQATMLAALSAVSAPGAVLSLLVRNGLAPAMRPGLLGRWHEAVTAFDSDRYVNRLGLAARMHTPAGVAPTLAPLGWTPARWYGVRVFSDHLDGDAPEGGSLQELLDAETVAGGRDPYRSVAALLHLVFTRGGPAAVAT
jgi:SAM-dependent methyltransferase